MIRALDWLVHERNRASRDGYRPPAAALLLMLLLLLG
jgi:hypothetical protein